MGPNDVIRAKINQVPSNFSTFQKLFLIAGLLLKKSMQQFRCLATALSGRIMEHAMLLFKRRSEQDCGYLNYSSSVDELRFNKIPIQPSWMAFNVSSLRSGWARIERNSNPDWVFDEVLGSKTAPPSPDHKPAFRIEVYVNDFGQAIWSSNAVGCLTGLDETLAEIMPTQEENPGKWAKVLYAGSVPRKIGRGSTRIPKFTFVGWIDPISFTVGQFNKSAQTNDPVNLPF